uniref:Uncharacterized protein n=1 Tax=Oryza punctata TaxID=4537 RepID=A0A0E0LU04_ORYPU
MRERGKVEVAEWKKLVEQVEATGGQARIAELQSQLQEARDDVQDLQGKLDASLATSELVAAVKVTLSVKLVKKGTALSNLQAEESDAAKGLREELIKLLEPTLKLLFPSRCDGKDPVQLATELVSEGPTAVRRLSESVASINASHALAVVKSHYPFVDLAAVEEGHAADCSEEDVD